MNWEARIWRQVAQLLIIMSQIRQLSCLKLSIGFLTAPKIKSNFLFLPFKAIFHVVLVWSTSSPVTLPLPHSASATPASQAWFFSYARHIPASGPLLLPPRGVVIPQTFVWLIPSPRLDLCSDVTPLHETFLSKIDKLLTLLNFSSHPLGFSDIMHLLAYLSVPREYEHRPGCLVNC